jgi:hypothetical protein
VCRWRSSMVVKRTMFAPPICFGARPTDRLHRTTLDEKNSADPPNEITFDSAGKHRRGLGSRLHGIRRQRVSSSYAQSQEITCPRSMDNRIAPGPVNRGHAPVLPEGMSVLDVERPSSMPYPRDKIGN